LSIGIGDSSRIYKTTDGGTHWKLQFKNTNERAFFDAMACWDKNHCIAMGDPVDNKFELINTTDGGATWKPMDTKNMPATIHGEAAFAASGTCLITQGKNGVFLVSGGMAARVFKSTDRGITWAVYDTPIVKGTSGSGIFSIAMLDSKIGVIVGGNYEKPELDLQTYATTIDGGMTWKVGNRWLGYRSGAAFIETGRIVAVGTTGSNISGDFGGVWKSFLNEVLNAVAARGKKAVWAVGPKGLVVKMK
jgi:photosystem II stability/assembly factor-like uncharacterized protein